MSELAVPSQNNFDRVAKCGARSKSTGQPCRQPAMPNGRCRKHGGKTPGGIASASWKHGKYSRVAKLPVKLAEAYQESLNDPQILELSDDIALLQGRLYELLEKVDTEESSKRWQMAKDAYDELMDATGRGDKFGIRVAGAKLGDILRDGGKDFMVWDDIMKTMANRSKLMAQEQKRRMDIHALISADQALGFVGTILLAVKAHVKDEVALREIHKAAQEALDKNPGLASGLTQ